MASTAPDALIPPTPSATPPTPEPRRFNLQNSLRPLLVPVLALFTAFICGSLVIVLTDVKVLEAFRNFGSSPSDAFRLAWASITTAYSSLLEGSLGNPANMISALQSGDQKAIIAAFYPISESLVASTPYIFAGLALAVGFDHVHHALASHRAQHVVEHGHHGHQVREVLHYLLRRDGPLGRSGSSARRGLSDRNVGGPAHRCAHRDRSATRAARTESTLCAIARAVYRVAHIRTTAGTGSRRP